MSVANAGQASSSTFVPGEATPAWPTKAPALGGSARHEATCEMADVAAPRAILFEMDNVLYDATFWQRWLWQLLSRMGVPHDFQGFSDRWQHGFLPDVHRGAATFASALRRFLEDRGLTAARIDEVEAASAAQRRDLNENIRPLPGVVQTLSQLSAAGIVLGVLANSELGGEELAARIGRLGLTGRFRVAYSSCELRCAKPDESCYQSALSALQLSAPQVAFVSPHADDLAAASKLGIRSIGLNANAGATVNVQRFEELLPICLPAVQRSNA